MQTNYVIRKASTCDVPQIVELWKELMDFHKERDQHFTRSAAGHNNFGDFILGRIRGRTSCVFVADTGQKVVGCCNASICKYPPVYEREKYGEIIALVVTERYRCKGIGEKLVREAKNWFSGKGIDRVEVPVATSNKLATKSWTKMGFTVFVETMFLEI